MEEAQVENGEGNGCEPDQMLHSALQNGDLLGQGAPLVMY